MPSVSVEEHERLAVENEMLRRKLGINAPTPRPQCDEVLGGVSNQTRLAGTSEGMLHTLHALSSELLDGSAKLIGLFYDTTRALGVHPTPRKDSDKPEVEPADLLASHHSNLVRTRYNMITLAVGIQYLRSHLYGDS